MQTTNTCPPVFSHTCPGCGATVHTNGTPVAWITADGRLLLEMASPAPTQQRWLELSGSRQNWVADLLRPARRRKSGTMSKLAPVDVKDEQWRSLLDQVVRQGHARKMTEIVPAGLEPGGIFTFRTRFPGGRVYLSYEYRSAGRPGRVVILGSVTPEYLEAAHAPQPFERREINVALEDGGWRRIAVHYDWQALPCRTEALMWMTELDLALTGGFYVFAVPTADLPAFVRLVAGVCETETLAPLPGDGITVGCPPWHANIFVPEGAAGWRAEIYRAGSETSLLLRNRQDAERLRQRLAEAAL